MSTNAPPRPVSRRPSTRLRRWAPWVLLIVATALISTLLAGTRSNLPLDPANPGRDGTRALVEVLGQQGVEVDVVRGVRSLEADHTRAGTTVVLGHTAYLGPKAGAALLDRLRDVDRLVVLVPDQKADPGTALGLDVSTAWSTGGRLASECTSAFVREGDAISTWDVQLDAAPGEPGVTACFPPTPGHNMGGARAGALLTYEATDERPEVVLVGMAGALTNAAITDDAHAAIGLRLLGQSPRLAWVLPQPADAGEEGASSLWEVLPRNLTPSVFLLLGALLALALWQGRRLGPVVTEPLPAVVRAIQTTTSRGRLYRQARDREHALAALQAGARRRLAPRLGLPSGAGPDELVRAVADATDRPTDVVARLLTDPRAADDTTFVTTARELRSLEEGLHP